MLLVLLRCSVLEDVVVNMANISPYHWLVVCTMSYGLGLFAREVLTTVEEVRSQTETVAEWSTNVPRIQWEGGEDDFGLGRRRLGGAAAEAGPCAARIPCEFRAAGKQSALAQALWDSAGGNISDDSYTHALYNSSCNSCESVAIDLPTTSLAIFGFVGFGFVLLVTQMFLLWFVSHRTSKIAIYHGAKDSRYLPALLRHLDKHLLLHAGRTAIDVGEHGEEDDDEDTGHDIMMVFHHAGKSANSLMSIHSYHFWMNCTKMNMLLNCFYFGFYVCHFQFRIDMAYSDRLITRVLTDVAVLLPCLMLTFVIHPKTSRKISLLFGILHMHHDAVQGVGNRMELVLQLRGRIRDRLKGARIVRGPPKLKKGNEMLQVVSTGETEILRTLNEMDRSETQRKHELSKAANKDRWSHHHEDAKPAAHRSKSASRIQCAYLRYRVWKTNVSVAKKFKGRLVHRITRAKAEALLSENKCNTPPDRLRDFLSRDAFRSYQEMDKWEKATATTAHTLRINEESESKDTIMMAEYHTFIVRCVAEIVNQAHEHGVPTETIDEAANAVIDLSIVSKEDFERARFLSKCRNMFEHVDTDRSGSINRREFRKMIRRYRIVMTPADLDIVWRVLDSDESEGVNMDTFIGFMTASDEDLVQRTLNASFLAMKANAEKGGEGLFDIALYAEEVAETLVSGVPGGDTVIGIMKDPTGATKEISNELYKGVVDSANAMIDAPKTAMQMVGLVEEDKITTSAWSDQMDEPTLFNDDGTPMAAGDDQVAMANPLLEEEEEEEEEQVDPTQWDSHWSGAAASGPRRQQESFADIVFEEEDAAAATAQPPSNAQQRDVERGDTGSSSS
eukprot:COSAG06_NODE_302_length_17869_cov_90.137535_7_plen_845_part_00